MTRRERLERKLEKRREWAQGRDRKASDLLARNEPYRGDIAFNTQPGHIPERARVIARTDRAMEHHSMADHHRTAAAGIERALDRSIFSDDADAVAQLAERIAENEAKRERMKLVNKLYRKGDAAKLAELGVDLEAMRTKLNVPDVMSWLRIPYAAYELSNLGGRITADRKRLEAVKARATRAAKAAEASGEVYIETLGEEYCRVTFAKKPEREVINALKAAGFYWGVGSWSGKRASLPDVVAAWLPKEGGADAAKTD